MNAVHDLCSDSWLEATRSYLAAGVLELPESARGAAYSMRFVLTDCPARLAEQGGSFAYWVSIEVPEVTVGRGDRQDLAGATSLHMDYATAHARTRTMLDPAELELRQGRASLEVDGAGSFPPDALLPLLIGLHNHMALRTA